MSLSGRGDLAAFFHMKSSLQTSIRHSVSWQFGQSPTQISRRGVPIFESYYDYSVVCYLLACVLISYHCASGSDTTRSIELLIFVENTMFNSAEFKFEAGFKL